MVRCTSWQDATSYELSIKKTEEHYYEENKEHAGTVRSNTKASTVANTQAQAVIEYLNAVIRIQTADFMLDIWIRRIKMY